MPAVEERLAGLESRVNEQSEMFATLRETLVRLEQRMDGRFAAIDGRFAAIDGRFDAIDRRFDAIDRRFEALDRRFEAVDRRFEAFDGRFGSIENTLSKNLLWTVGIQMTVLALVMIGLITMLLK